MPVMRKITLERKQTHNQPTNQPTTHISLLFLTCIITCMHYLKMLYKNVLTCIIPCFVGSEITGGNASILSKPAVSWASTYSMVQACGTFLSRHHPSTPHPRFASCLLSVLSSINKGKSTKKYFLKKRRRRKRRRKKTLLFWIIDDLS